MTEYAAVMSETERQPRRTIPPERKAMGRRIKKARQDAGLSQAQVANKLSDALSRDIPRQTYQHYESGFASVESMTLKALAKILGTTVDYLLGNEETAVPPGVVAFFETEPEDRHGAYEKSLKQLRDILNEGRSRED